jgi:hypothetical protein
MAVQGWGRPFDDPIKVDGRKPVTLRDAGEHIKVFTTVEAAETWFENDPKGAFEYDVLDRERCTWNRAPKPDPFLRGATHEEV